jgi:hypothetical protein
MALAYRFAKNHQKYAAMLPQENGPYVGRVLSLLVRWR